MDYLRKYYCPDHALTTYIVLFTFPSAIKIVTPKLSVKARQGPSPEGFVQKNSRLESYNLHPLFFHWNNGNIGNVYHIEGSELSVLNVMKGISSLFQVCSIEFCCYFWCNYFHMHRHISVIAFQAHSWYNISEC